MIPYKNLSHKSGVAAYQIRKDAILIRFISDGTYLYNYERPGKKHVEKMKKLAEAGEGLSTYISQHVRENYAEKIN
jgi:hypothetical protein